jgi:thiamine kinase-like enzyme
MQNLTDFLASMGITRPPDSIEPLRGLSNRNVRVRIGQEDWVVRLASANAERLGISRKAELQVLHLAEDAGLGPEVVHFALPEGHLVTKPIPAKEIGQTPERYREPNVLRAIVQTVKRIHGLPAIEHRFDPIDRIRAAFRRAAEHAVPLPEGSEGVLRRLDAIEAARGPLSPADTALCHNDLFAGNILDSDPIRVIDWEFAGMGDIFFDLATLVVACDESEPLGEKHRVLILEEYFGKASPKRLRRLDDMVFVVRLHVVAWGLTHHVLGTEARGWEGFTFLGFATELLNPLISET